MRTITLEALQAQVAARKAALGIEDTPEWTESLRNKGGSHTPEKRELLRQVEERARPAGRTPMEAYS